MSTVFVTGGSGFVGGALIRRLVADGHQVRALARSDTASATVTDLGAEPVRGDLSDPASLREACAGNELVFHAAAQSTRGGGRAAFVRGNVDGTRNVIAACRDSGVRRLVHVGTEAALMAGQPLVNIDETAPLRPDSAAHYSATKAMAEQAVRDANDEKLETVVVRPRFVWGRGDTTLLPVMTEMVRAGRFAWIGGGRHRTSTTHVDNVVHGLLLGAERGAPGGVYFVTDGTPVVFRDFVTRLLATQGVTPPGRSLPAPVARAVATVGETAWRLLPLPGRPPLTRLAVWVSALETTIDITRARTELGYEPVRTIDQGLEELQP